MGSSYIVGVVNRLGRNEDGVENALLTVFQRLDKYPGVDENDLKTFSGPGIKLLPELGVSAEAWIPSSGIVGGLDTAPSSMVPCGSSFISMAEASGFRCSETWSIS